MLKRAIRVVFFVYISLVCTACANIFAPLPKMPTQAELDSHSRLLAAQAKNLKPEVVRLALVAYYKARREGYAQQNVLTVIDYSKPSTQRRFWVFDLRTNKLLFKELVAHGKNSGDKVATRFSDQMGSLTSSIGVYVTEKNAYVGRHGYALRLVGLEKGYNAHARERAIVVHGAPYVSREFAKQNGRLGLSWGCPALNPKVVKPVIDHIKGGTLVFAYYPDQKWMQESRFLKI